MCDRPRETKLTDHKKAPVFDPIREQTRTEASLSHRTSSTQDTNGRIKAITEEIHKMKIEKSKLQEKISDLKLREALIKNQKGLDKKTNLTSKAIEKMVIQDKKPQGYRTYLQDLDKLRQENIDIERQLSDIANRTKGYSTKDIGLLEEKKEKIEESIENLHIELDSIVKILKTKIIQKDEEILKTVNSIATGDIEEVLMDNPRPDINKVISEIYDEKIKKTSDDPNSQNLNPDKILQLKQSTLASRETYSDAMSNRKPTLMQTISVKFLGNPNPILTASDDYRTKLRQYVNAKIIYTIDNCQEYQERLNLQQLLEEAESKIKSLEK